MELLSVKMAVCTDVVLAFSLTLLLEMSTIVCDRKGTESYTQALYSNWSVCLCVCGVCGCQCLYTVEVRGQLRGVSSLSIHHGS